MRVGLKKKKEYNIMEIVMMKIDILFLFLIDNGRDGNVEYLK